MTPFNEARQKRHNLKTEALKILEVPAHQRTAQASERFTEIENEIRKVDLTIDALARNMELDNAGIRPANRDNGFHGDSDYVRQQRAVAAQPRVALGRSYAGMFGAHAIDNGGWTSPDEFFATLHQGLSDQRLAYAPARGLQAIGTVGTPSDGGFTVPTTIAAQWLDAALEDEVVRPRATVYPMTSNSIKVPGFDGANHTSNVFGGFGGGWVGEAGEISPETPKLRLIELMARKLGILAEVSNELISDGVGYATQLNAAMIKALSYYLDYAFLNGDGASKPAGVLSSSALIVVAKETNQTAGTILYENLTKMFSRMAPQCVKNSVWVAHQSTIPALAQLSVAIGTGGSLLPVMSESDGSFKILTRPVIFTEKVPSIGSQGDIMLADFSQYAIGLRADMTLDKSSHVGFTRDVSHYRGIVRADGMACWDKAVTLKGAFTVSPFVTLAVRS